MEAGEHPRGKVCSIQEGETTIEDQKRVIIVQLPKSSPSNFYDDVLNNSPLRRMLEAMMRNYCFIQFR